MKKTNYSNESNNHNTTQNIQPFAIYN